VEGDTEVLFYQRVKEQLLGDIRRVTIEQLHGIFNINKKILNKIFMKSQSEIIRVYCCLDRESRHAVTPGFDIDFIKKEVVSKRLINVLGVDAIIATQMIESWFFYDLDGIYKFLEAPKAQRKKRAYQPPERFRVKDLGDLFRRHNRVYQEGKRAANFINHLDIGKIARECKEMREGLELIRRQARDRTNHIFGA